MKKGWTALSIVLVMVLAGCGQTAAAGGAVIGSAVDGTDGVVMAEAPSPLGGEGQTGRTEASSSPDKEETDGETPSDKAQGEGMKAESGSGSVEQLKADVGSQGSIQEVKAEDAETAEGQGAEKTVLQQNTQGQDTGKQPAQGEADGGDVPGAGQGNLPGGQGGEPALPSYSVTAFQEPRVMYASQNVNVRKGPSTDYEKIGLLPRAQAVQVTGQASTGWYELDYNGQKGYVSNGYVQSEQPKAETQQPPAAGVIFVGDSRTVQMQSSVGENPYTWIAECGQGYKWFKDTAVARIDNNVGQGSRILLNLGVNDINNVNNYLTLVNTKAAEWIGKGATVYYASVNPVTDNPYVTDEDVANFNARLQAGLSQDIHWIDSYSYLYSIGFRLVDGLHFNKETYQNLYNFYLGSMG